MGVMDVKNIDLQIKTYKTCFFTFVKNIIKTLNCRCFQLLLFRHYTRKEYLTQIIKNKILPFVKTKKRNVLNIQIKKQLNAICP